MSASASGFNSPLQWTSVHLEAVDVAVRNDSSSRSAEKHGSQPLDHESQPSRQLVVCSSVYVLFDVGVLLTEDVMRYLQGNLTHSRPELRQDYPLNLSISISGGKENNYDSPSNGERTGNSPT